MLRKSCQECGKKFKPKRDWQKFCSSICTNRWHTARTKKAREMLNNLEQQNDAASEERSVEGVD